MEIEGTLKECEITIPVNTYNVTIKLQGEKIRVRAFSESLLKLFTGQFVSSDFPEDIQAFGGCSGIFSLLEQCVEEKRAVSLSDLGQLKFACSVNLGKLKLNKNINFMLKQKEFTEVETLKLKIQKLQKKLEHLLTPPKPMKFQIDTQTSYFNKFKIQDRIVSLNPGTTTKWYSLFDKNRISGVQQFEFELISMGITEFSIGIAAENHKNELNNFSKQFSMTLMSKNRFFNENKRQTVNWTDNNSNSRVIMIINLMKFTVKWKLQGLTIAKADISEKMRDKPLYAFIQLYDNNNADKIKIY